MSYRDFKEGYYADDEYDVGYFTPAEASVDDRAEFIRKTYMHLGGAILAFAGLSAILVNSSFATGMLVKKPAPYARQLN